jgi:threonine dehydrogenase-like Zn-dependent dehydrogenase
MDTTEYELTGPGTGTLTAGDVADPGPGELVLEVIHNGVCASDLAGWAAGPDGSAVHLGHEPVGTVAACGLGVAIQEGTWVTGRVTETYSKYAVADARDVVPLPPDLDPRVALGEPVGCVVDGLGHTPVRIGDRVAVIGAGFMGRVAIQLLVHSWAAHVTVVEVRDDARAAALEDGADAAHDPHDGEIAGLAGAYDVVVEATGTQAGLNVATSLVREHGVLSILGYHQSDRTVDMQAWNWKSLTVVNAHVRDRDRLRDSVRRGLDLMVSGRLDLPRLVTHRFAFDDVDSAFRALRDKPPGFVKAIIDIG